MRPIECRRCGTEHMNHSAYCTRCQAMKRMEAENADLKEQVAWLVEKISDITEEQADE